jgi:poly(3-hydroxybutyrate) depolymerase
VADAEGVLVLTPESTTGPGASWDPQSDGAVIDALVVEMESQYNVDTCRRYVAGFSNGAHYAYMVGLGNAEAFAGIGVVAGSLQWAQDAGIWPNEVDRPVAVAIHHATDDPVIPFSHGTASRDALENRGHPVYFTQLDNVGHTIKKSYATQIWADLKHHASNE